MISESPEYPELSTKLGHIVRLCSNLEGIISIFISNLISPDLKLGEIITAGLSFKNLTILLNALFRYRFSNPKKIIELKQLLTRAEQCENRRNEIIHASWGFDINSKLFVRMKSTKNSKKGLRNAKELISLNNLDDVVKELDKVIIDILHFIMDNISTYPLKKSKHVLKH